MRFSNPPAFTPITPPSRVVGRELYTQKTGICQYTVCLGGMKYDKLVRDNIHEENLAQGIHSVAYAADEDEYRVKLKEKLSEEVEEFLASEDVKELADILEVVYALSELQSISRDEIERIRAEKENKKGAFKKRIILEESDWA